MQYIYSQLVMAKSGRLNQGGNIYGKYSGGFFGTQCIFSCNVM